MKIRATQATRDSRVKAFAATKPIAAPRSCAAMNGNTEAGAMPAKVSENIRPIVTAGFANDVEEV
jgi:hypothetical protein